MVAWRLRRLLGERLEVDGATVPVDEICDKVSVVGLFFQTSHCEQCKNFAPLLSDLCNKIPQLVVVQVNWGNDGGGSLKGVPWFAVPFKDTPRLARIRRRFRVQAVPTLVLIDGSTGRTITTRGREYLEKDPLGGRFPWRPRAIAEILKDVDLIRGEEKENDKEQKGETALSFCSLRNCYKGLYFSASWCPPCKAFTPQLVSTYWKILEAGHNFQVILVSSDRTHESFQHYLSSVPWPAVPFSYGELRDELAELFDVQGIPSLIVLDEEDQLVTTTARWEVKDDSRGKRFPWQPETVEELSPRQTPRLHDPFIVLFVDSDPCQVKFAHDVLLSAAEASIHSDNDQQLNFFIGNDSETSDSVRDAAGLDDVTPLLAIIDLVAGERFVVPDNVQITAHEAHNFVLRWHAGLLTPSQIHTVAIDGTMITDIV